MGTAAGGRDAAVASRPGFRLRSARADTLAILLLLAISLIPRLMSLDADPPRILESGFVYDEGEWWKNARQHALFGEWQMDSYNPALYVAPLYSVGLAAVYRVGGVGLAQSHLLNALSGALICLLLYGVLRFWYPVPLAMAPAAVLALSWFMIAYNRSGYIETFQLLFMAMSAAGVLLAVRHPAWGIGGGTAFVLALLVKPSAIVLGFIFLAFWISHFLLSRRGGMSPRFSFRGPTYFTITAAAALGIVVLVLVVPHLAQIRAQIAADGGHVFSESGHGPGGRVALFGWDRFGFRLNGFFRNTWLLLLPVLLLAVTRMTGAARRRLDIVELFFWNWLVTGMLFLGLQFYQPDRRFLFLMPAVAVLAAAGCLRSGLFIPDRARGSDWRSPARILAGALLGGAVGFYFLHAATSRTAGLNARTGLALSPEAVASVAWAGAIFVGALAAIVLSRWFLPRRAWPIPLFLLAAAFLTVDASRFLSWARQRTHTMKQISRDLDAMTTDWSVEDRRIIGGDANTFSMGTRLVAFMDQLDGTDPWSLRPALASMSWTRNRPEPAFATISREHGFVPCREYDYLPDETGRLRYHLAIYIRAGLASACHD